MYAFVNADHDDPPDWAPIKVPFSVWLAMWLESCESLRGTHLKEKLRKCFLSARDELNEKQGTKPKIDNGEYGLAMTSNQ